MKEYIVQENPRVTTHELQKVLLMMLRDFDELCQRNNIDYWLAFGTALGAKRHQGFIPWDDDLDVAITSDQYPLLLEALKKDLPTKYYFDSYETDDRYNVLIPDVKIRLRKTKVIEANRLLRNKCTNGDAADNDGLFIDVFVHNHSSGNKWQVYWQNFKRYLYVPGLVLLDNLGSNPVLLKNCYKRSIAKYDKMSIGCGYWESPWVWQSMFRPFLFKTTDIFPTERVKFENLSLPVPQNIEQYLTIAIGQNWHQYPPQHKRISKHVLQIDLGEYQTWQEED